MGVAAASPAAEKCPVTCTVPGPLTLRLKLWSRLPSKHRPPQPKPHWAQDGPGDRVQRTTQGAATLDPTRTWAHQMKTERGTRNDRQPINKHDSRGNVNRAATCLGFQGVRA